MQQKKTISFSTQTHTMICGTYDEFRPKFRRNNEWMQKSYTYTLIYAVDAWQNYEIYTLVMCLQIFPFHCYEIVTHKMLRFSQCWIRFELCSPAKLVYIDIKTTDRRQTDKYGHFIQKWTSRHTPSLSLCTLSHSRVRSLLCTVCARKVKRRKKGQQPNKEYEFNGVGEVHFTSFARRDKERTVNASRWTVPCQPNRMCCPRCFDNSHYLVLWVHLPLLSSSAIFHRFDASW